MRTRIKELCREKVSSAFILFDDQKCPIRQTNRNENYPRSKK